jgi:hypothetical protein
MAHSSIPKSISTLISKLSWLGLISLLLVGCTANQPIPTVSSVEMAQTSQYLTQVAPPLGFEQQIAFPHIDDKLSEKPSWRYTASLSFEGVFTGTDEQATGEISAEIFSSELTSERRVLLNISGPAFGLNGDRSVEGVRIRNDYYLVDSNKSCAKIANPTPGQVADLDAGTLIGGIKKALPAGQRKTENEIDLWEYTFTGDDVVPPTLKRNDNATVNIAAGDVWVAPSLNAVWNYTITFDVDNVILQGDKPVTGKLRGTYQLIEVGAQYNIAIPFGC